MENIKSYKNKSITIFFFYKIFLKLIVLGHSFTFIFYKKSPRNMSIILKVGF